VAATCARTPASCGPGPARPSASSGSRRRRGDRAPSAGRWRRPGAGASGGPARGRASGSGSPARAPVRDTSRQAPEAEAGGRRAMPLGGALVRDLACVSCIPWSVTYRWYVPWYAPYCCHGTRQEPARGGRGRHARGAAGERRAAVQRAGASPPPRWTTSCGTPG
jgi:hypothetical protein